MMWFLGIASMLFVTMGIVIMLKAGNEKDAETDLLCFASEVDMNPEIHDVQEYILEG